MWFVILALLIVAAYFVYDALRDRRLAESGNALSTAKRMQINENPAANSPADERASGSADSSQSQTFVNPQDSNSATPNSVDDTAKITGASAAAAGAGAAVAGIVGAASGSGHKEQTSSGQLHFLDAPIGQKDDLTRIDGIGPVIEGELNTLGIYHYHQIGNFSDSDVESVNNELDFPNRIQRENWIPQARKLMTDSHALGNDRSANTATAPASGTASTDKSSTAAERNAPSGLSGSGATVAGVGAVAAGAALAGSHAANTSQSEAHDDTDSDWSLTEGDLTGAWNTDLLVEIQERLNVLNTRESDAPRLNISREDYRAIKDDDDERFTREELSTLLDRLRTL